VNVVDYDMPIQQAVDSPRTHHQWFPDRLQFEGTKQHSATLKALADMGHQVVYARQGDCHSIWINPKTGGYIGAADKRLSGKSSGY
jgi:gamma-glutamyltranspeptidase/glutathione hydrolase